MEINVCKNVNLENQGWCGYLIEPELNLLYVSPIRS